MALFSGEVRFALFEEGGDTFGSISAVTGCPLAFGFDQPRAGQIGFERAGDILPQRAQRQRRTMGKPGGQRQRLVLQDGVIDGRLAARSPRIVPNGRTFAYVLHRGGVELKITQNDVRAIQLAKAALYAGVALLMERLGIERVDRIRLAGAFGSHIDVKYAMILGMVPDCDLAEVRSAGNAAGTGARIALLDATSRGVVEGLVKRIEKVETAIEPRFQHHFVEAMALPHKTAPYASLRKVVELPAPKESSSQSETRGRRPRRADAVKPD